MFKVTFRSKGVALFISVLMTMSLSIIALATMARLSEVSHTTGKELQDRRLLVYAYSAVNIVNGELRRILRTEFLQFRQFVPPGRSRFDDERSEVG